MQLNPKISPAEYEKLGRALMEELAKPGGSWPIITLHFEVWDHKRRIVASRTTEPDEENMDTSHVVEPSLDVRFSGTVF